ncbi:alpha-L-fucosidase [Sinomicrobium weinanense]|uniref:alpha-L-fucosidase n=1 Tax=Sinomicrobium weinanense TaxID=2842200 RepID=A0A926JV50_9FLAO|nr:alpha-L-fucosidase [Sinomicrobium weinanense]MBC9798150.1 alpha-L-fucosidase [Sinomicrobium weinanense]MBU3122571.1 alpha-L-fucosidase [Sinomicrobium weinanense]
MKKLNYLLALSFCVLSVMGYGQGNEKLSDAVDERKMEWFADAKLGIFIHWGIYAVNGIDESWSFYNDKISHKDYMKQLRGFTADKYDPEYWADLIKESGAQYAVLTSRHHDGVALWNSKQGGVNTIKDTPAKRDLVTPFVNAIKARDIKVGMYYSLSNWSHKDYNEFTREEKRYDIKKEPRRWERYKKYMFGQIREVAENFNPDLWWFDGDWEHSAEEWEAPKVRELLLKNNPNTIINSRLQGHGDYSTPEQGTPIFNPPAKYWELCLTMNGSWGYQPLDTEYKTPYEVVRIFVDMVSMGGNLLLDIGPKANGEIPEEQVHILKELGQWLNKHKEAIYATRKGIDLHYFYGPTTLSKDRKTLYLFVPGTSENELVLKGVKNKINSVSVVGSGEQLDFYTKGAIDWAKYPGIAYIKVPENVIDTYMTVLKVELDSPLELFNKYGPKVEEEK